MFKSYTSDAPNFDFISSTLFESHIVSSLLSIFVDDVGCSELIDLPAIVYMGELLGLAYFEENDFKDSKACKLSSLDELEECLLRNTPSKDRFRQVVGQQLELFSKKMLTRKKLYQDIYSIIYSTLLSKKNSCPQALKLNRFLFKAPDRYTMQNDDSAESLPAQIKLDLPPAQVCPLITTAEMAAIDSLNSSSQPTKTPVLGKKKLKKKNTQRSQQPRLRTLEIVEDSTEQKDDETTTVKPTMPPVSALKCKHDWRVWQWFSQSFIDIKKPSKEEILYHSFPLLIDNELMRCGDKQPYHNKSHEGQIDTVYTLPAKVIFPDNSSKYAAISCCVDPDRICYHRQLKFTSWSDLASAFNLSADVVGAMTHELPAANDGFEFPRVQTQKYKKYGRVIQDNGTYVTFEDSYNEVTIIVYRRLCDEAVA